MTRFLTAVSAKIDPVTRLLTAGVAKIEKSGDVQVALITIGGLAAILGMVIFYFLKIAPNIPVPPS